MSSHHIVREKQEPALLVLGLESFPDELLGQLLEWSPTVITTLHTAEQLHTYGIKIDWVITDGGDINIQSDVKLMSAGEGNLTDAALNYLVGFEYPSVNIITDELRLQDYEHFANRIDLVIFNQHRKIYPVSSGFSKWKPSGDMIELLSPVNGLFVKGLKKTDNNRYTTEADGFFSLQFDDPFLFIAEDL